MSDSKDAQKIVGRSEVPFRSRAFAAYSLGLIGRASADERIKKEIVLAHIPNAMAKLLRKIPAGDFTRKATMDQLLQILRNKPKRDILIRQSAVQAVGMMATAKDDRNEDIFRTLKFLSKKVRNQQLKHYTAIATAHLGTASPKMRRQALDFLLDNMKKSSTSYEPWCGLALGVMAFQLQEHDEALPQVAMEATLSAFMRCKAPDRKAAFALALGLMNYTEGARDIRDSMMRIKDSQFRGYAAVSLGLLNSREHMELITEMVTES